MHSFEIRSPLIPGEAWSCRMQRRMPFVLQAQWLLSKTGRGGGRCPPAGARVCRHLRWQELIGCLGSARLCLLVGKKGDVVHDAQQAQGHGQDQQGRGAGEFGKSDRDIAQARGLDVGCGTLQGDAQ